MGDLFLQALLLSDSTIRLATPLVLAALAGLFCERSGVVDIALEGKMLGAAFAAAATAAVTGSAWLGLGAGMLFSVGLAMVHGFACITHRGNQVVSGMALNIMVAGLGPTLAEAWFHQGGRTPLLGDEARFTPITLPLADALHDVPVLGPLYYEVISGHNLLVYATAAIVPLVAWVVYRTRFGLRLRAVGENPSAVDTAGISVTGHALPGAGRDRPAVRHRRHLSVDRPQRVLHPRHDRGQGLSGAGGADLRQMAPAAGAARLFSVCFHRRGADPPAGHPTSADRHGPDPGDPGPALPRDRPPARRLRRPRHSAQGDRRPLCQGAMKPMTDKELIIHQLERMRIPRVEEATGWEKVDRTVGEIRRRLAEAQTAEQFQAVGLLCREAS